MFADVVRAREPLRGVYDDIERLRCRCWFVAVCYVNDLVPTLSYNHSQQKTSKSDDQSEGAREPGSLTIYERLLTLFQETFSSAFGQNNEYSLAVSTTFRKQQCNKKMLGASGIALVLLQGPARH